METKKRMLTMLLTAALLAAPLTACDMADDAIDTTNENTEETLGTTETSASQQKPIVDIEGENPASDFSYEINENGTITLKKYFGNDPTPTIPNRIDGKPVTKIGDFSFSGLASLKSVALNEGLLEIGQYAFVYSPNLKTLTIPESVIDGGYRLYESSIEIIYGKKGSFAETCAAKNSIDFADSQIGYTREYSKEPVDPTILDYIDFCNRNQPLVVCFGDTGGADALFGYDRYGQCYTHVPAWNSYFQTKLQGEPRDALVSGDHLWIMSSSEDGSQITTYKFLKDGTLLDSYSNTLPFAASDSWSPECDSWLYNCYQEDAFYAFFIEYGKCESDKPQYAMHQFQSTDGGKTWIQEEGYQVTFSDDDIEALDFFTNEIGVIATRRGYNHCADFVYVTFDGGGTWNPMEELPCPAEWGEIEEFYLESITYEDNEYRFFVIIYPKKGPTQITTFVSKDFVNWEMKEHRLMDP